MQTLEIGASPLQAIGGQYGGGHVRTSQSKLCGLAAGRGAKIGNTFSGDVAKELCREACRRILHPPLTLGKAWEAGQGAFNVGKPNRAGWQGQTAKTLG